MRWKERRKYGRLEHLASARCLFGACYRTAFGLQSDCRDMAWTITTLAPCVHNARSPVTISLWCACSVVSYGTNASITAAGITSRRLQVTNFQDGGFDRGSKYDRFPPAAHGWGTKHSVLNNTPLLLTEEEGPPT
jgi:hypothetical protein